MGWGIKIPSLGIDTGEFIGGEGGKLLSNISREANTPIGRTLLGGALGPILGLDKYIQDNKPDLPPGANPDDLNSKWQALTDRYTGQGLTDTVQAGVDASKMGVGAGLAGLGQKGGQSVGAEQRLKAQSKWDMAQGAAEANQAAQIGKTSLEQNRILGIDVPLAQGKDLAAAQASAAARQRAGGLGGLIGTIGGYALGGPIGGAIGGSLGTGLGSATQTSYRPNYSQFS